MDNGEQEQVVNAVRAQAIGLRVLSFWLFWIALSEGEAIWSWGVAATLFATVLSLWLVPAPRTGFRSLPALLRGFGLAPFLIREGLASGWDVARRAFSPGPPLAPTLLEFPLRYPGGPVPIALAYALTAMPGTLAVDLRDGRLFIHVVDRGLPNRERVAELERRLARVLGEEADD